MGDFACNLFIAVLSNTCLAILRVSVFVLEPLPVVGGLIPLLLMRLK